MKVDPGLYWKIPQWNLDQAHPEQGKITSKSSANKPKKKTKIWENQKFQLKIEVKNSLLSPDDQAFVVIQLVL